jgi:hypothetical protein
MVGRGVGLSNIASIQYRCVRSNYHDADTRQTVRFDNNFRLPALAIHSYTNAAGKLELLFFKKKKWIKATPPYQIILRHLAQRRPNPSVDFDQRVCPGGDLEGTQTECSLTEVSANSQHHAFEKSPLFCGVEAHSTSEMKKQSHKRLSLFDL